MKRRFLKICALAAAILLGACALAEGEIDMLAVDHKLYELGYRDGACNGVLDEVTIGALRSFQMVNGLEVTGEPDDETVARLLGEDAVSKEDYLSALAQENASMTTLADGAYGEGVSRLQRTLKKLGYFNGSSDGAFGDETQAAVYRFQLANGLRETGIADSAVLIRLYSDDPVAWEDFLTAGCASVGDSGGRVRTIQIWLKHKGYFSGECTGRYGDGTQQAVKRFQADMDLEPSGDVDMETCRALYWDADALLEESYAIRRGETGADVDALCNSLRVLGYPAHSRFNMQTELALMQFQLVNGLDVNGVADEETRARLYSDRAVVPAGFSASGSLLPDADNLGMKFYRTASALLGQLSELDTDFGFVQYVALKCGAQLMDAGQLTRTELGAGDDITAGEMMSIRVNGREVFGIATADRAIIYRADSGYVVMSYLEALELELVCVYRAADAV